MYVKEDMRLNSTVLHTRMQNYSKAETETECASEVCKGVLQQS